MPKPKMGSRVGDYKTDMGGGAGSPTGGSISHPIIDILTQPQGPQTQTAQPEMPQTPQWGQPTADPNQGFMPIIGGAGSPGFNPNTDMNAGVPISNTPNLNQQNTPGFALNQNYSPTPSAGNILSALMSDIGPMSMGGGAG